MLMLLDNAASAVSSLCKRDNAIIQAFDGVKLDSEALQQTLSLF